MSLVEGSEVGDCWVYLRNPEEANVTRLGWQGGLETGRGQSCRLDGSQGFS